MSNVDEEPPRQRSTASKRRMRLGVLAFILIGLSIVILIAIDSEGFASRLTEFAETWRHELRTDPIRVYLIAFFIYVLVTAGSIPGAAPLTLLYGWIFGWWRAAFMVSFASTLGATIAFFTSRYLLRSFFEDRFSGAFKRMRGRLSGNLSLSLFSMRLVPVFPFWLVNLLFGLTTIRWRAFWWVSQLGMLPATIVYTFAGSRVPSLERLQADGVSSVWTPLQLVQITTALCLMAILPWFGRFVIRRGILRPPNISR